MGESKKIIVITENQTDEIIDFWSTIYNSLELLDNIIISEAKKNKANVTRIREDINRAMVTSNREYKIIKKLLNQPLH